MSSLSIQPTLSVEQIASRLRELGERANQIQQSNARASAERLGAGLPSLAIGQGSGVGGLGAQGNGTERADFHAVLKDAIRGVSDAQNSAQAKAQAYQLGDDKVSLEDVMISIQKASLAMQGMVQVRNRLVEGYREVMNMQV